MRTVAIVAARMGSRRLPGKAMMEIGGKPMLAHVLERASQAEVDEVVLATGSIEDNAVLMDLAHELGFPCFVGDDHDVLGRLNAAARLHEADVVVRVTGDCPMLEPSVVDRVIGGLTDDIDISTNTVVRSYPRGLDAEAMHADVLARLCRLADSPKAREHVTFFAYKERPDLFMVRHVTQPTPWKRDPDMNLSVDTAADLERVRGAFQFAT